MPTIPAPAGPSRAMAASRTMLENVRLTLFATTMRPDHQVSTARNPSTTSGPSMTRGSLITAAVVSPSPSAATRPM